MPLCSSCQGWYQGWTVWIAEEVRRDYVWLLTQVIVRYNRHMGLISVAYRQAVVWYLLSPELFSPWGRYLSWSSVYIRILKKQVLVPKGNASTIGLMNLHESKASKQKANASSFMKVWPSLKVDFPTQMINQENPLQACPTTCVLGFHL